MKELLDSTNAVDEVGVSWSVLGRKRQLSIALLDKLPELPDRQLDDGRRVGYFEHTVVNLSSLQWPLL